MDAELLWKIARIGLLTCGVPGVLCACWWVFRVIGRSERRFCPGPVRGWLGRLLPTAWFTARVCGYDLRGLPRGDDGTVLCPECGSWVEVERRALRRVFRWRAGRAAAVCCSLAMVTASPYWLKTRSWQRWMPTTALIVTKRALGPVRTPTRIQRELFGRMEFGQLTEFQKALVIPALIADLRDDGRTRNAEYAAELLSHLGESAWAPLERAPRSPDLQQRTLAAELLRDVVIPVESVEGAPRTDQWAPRNAARRRIAREPSDDLLRVTFENLGRWVEWSGEIEQASNPYVFLAQFPERTAPLAAAALKGRDDSRRLRAAALVVVMREPTLMRVAAGVLIDHLKDNGVWRDARFAALALHAMGPEAEEHLEPYLYAADRQQRELARLVYQNLRTPATWSGGFPDGVRLWQLTYPWPLVDAADMGEVIH